MKKTININTILLNKYLICKVNKKYINNKFKKLKESMDKYKIDKNILYTKLNIIIGLPFELIINLKQPFCITTWFNVYDDITYLLENKNIKKIDDGDLNNINEIIDKNIIVSFEKGWKIYGNNSSEILSGALAFMVIMCCIFIIIGSIYIYYNYNNISKNIQNYFKKQIKN